MNILDILFEAIALNLLVMGLCTGIVLTLRSAWHTWTAGIDHVRALHQVPCHQCQYFTGDYRLKCTVQPYLAGTLQATGCPDYDQKGATERPQTQAEPAFIPSCLKTSSIKAHFKETYFQ